MKKRINNSGFRALPSSVQNNILSNMKYGGNTFAAGGAMPMEQLTEFDEGGRHEENGLGGIPQGMNPEGQMNLVEEGETKFDAENYIYSDSLKVDKELAEAFNLNPKMVGKTFADASKMAGRKKSKREGDAIEDAANEKDLTNLMEAQEAFKQARIEEKLQEIAELDPNALPALMGQGQPQGGPQEGAPQGDPAMGGQMQEAPMDEQAMMEQQMMAEQQGGGGQPSPEEMAMMEQQQNQMMGQQEGMMRNGGYATRSYNPGGDLDVKAGQYPMTEEESKAWYNNSEKRAMFDAQTRLGESQERSNNNNPEAEAEYKAIIDNYQPQGPIVPLEDQVNAANKKYPYYDGFYETEFKGGMNNKGWNNWREKAKGEFSDMYTKDYYPEVGTGLIKRSGGQMSNEDLLRQQQMATRSYAPGGFMGANAGMMNMANAGAMGMSADPGCRCANGTTSTACCGRNYDEFDEGVYKEKFDNSGEKIRQSERKAGFRGSNRKLPFWHRQALKKADVNYGQQTTGAQGGTNTFLLDDSNMAQNYANIDMDQYTPEQQKLMQGHLWAKDPGVWDRMNPGILNKKDLKQVVKVNKALSWTPAAKKVNYGVTPSDRERFPGSSDKGVASHVQGPRRGTSYPIDTENKWTWLSGVTSSDKFAGKKRYKPKLFQSKNIKTNEFGGSLMQPVQGTGMNQMGTNMAQSGFNQNMVQPMNTMGKGGKMCYGCGGAVHNYGGRMDGIQGDPAKYGKWLDIGSKALGAAGNVVGTVMPWAGAAIGGVAGGMESLSDNAAASDDGSVDWRGIDWADMAKDVGVGAASGAMGAAGAGAKLALSTGDQLADSLYENKYEKQEAEHLAILNDPNADPDSAEYINAVNKEQERSKGQGAFGIAGQAIGAAGSILSGKVGDAAKNAPGAVMDSGIDTIPNEDIIPEMNFSKYGGNLMRGGGRLYNTGGPLTLKKTSTNPDGTTIERDVTYNSLEELLADAEMVNKYGGQDAIKANFSAHFSPKSAIPSAFTTPIQNIETQAARTNPNNIATQEDQNAMISYINQMKQDAGPNLNEQNMQNISMLTDMRGPNSLSGEFEVPSMPVNNVVENTQQEQQQQQVMPEEETVLDDPSKVNVTANEGGNDNEVDIDPNLSNSKKNISFKETPLEFASKMAGPLYNIGSGLFSKPKDYNPDYIPVDAPKLDATESINSIKRNVAGVRRSLNKVGNNPSQLLALAQTGSRLESQAIQEIDNINAKLEFEAEKLNKAEKQKLNKLKKQLEMSLDEAKRKSIQEGIAQFGEIATTNQANKLAQQYASMGVDNIGGIDYKTYPQQLLDLIKENRKKRKAKKNN